MFSQAKADLKDAKSVEIQKGKLSEAEELEIINKLRNNIIVNDASITKLIESVKKAKEKEAGGTFSYSSFRIGGYFIPLSSSTELTKENIARLIRENAIEKFSSSHEYYRDNEMQKLLDGGVIKQRFQAAHCNLFIRHQKMEMAIAPYDMKNEAEVISLFAALGVKSEFIKVTEKSSFGSDGHWDAKNLFVLIDFNQRDILMQGLRLTKNLPVVTQGMSMNYKC